MTIGPTSHARRRLPIIHVRSASSISLPPPRPQLDTASELAADVDLIVGDLTLEALDDALIRGIPPREWLGKEQVKLWTLQEKASRILRSLHKDYAFDSLVSDSKDLHRARRALLLSLDGAQRAGDRTGAAEIEDKLAEIDSSLADNLRERDGWHDWKVYVELAHRNDARVMEMRSMWEESQRVPFDNAWKGHFHDRA